MYSPNSSRSRLQAFTLIELLVVIAIIGVLAALLFSVIGRMQNSAGTTKTVGNLKQLMSASFAYAAEHNGHYVPIRIDVVSWPQGGPDALPNALNRWMTHPKFLAYFGIEGNEMISGQPKNWAPVAMSGRNVTVLNGGQIYTNGRQTLGINKTDLIFSPANPGSLGNNGRMGFRMTEIKHPNRMIAFAEANDWMVAHTENNVNLIDHWEEKYDQGEANPRVAAPAFRNDGKVAVATYSGSVQLLTRDEAREFDRWSVRAEENQ